jgi:ribosomal protein S18 acetylase RimI-like enzyme
MESSEVHRISEIDRTEHISQVYRMNGSSLEVEDVDWHAGPWDSASKLEEWSPIAEGFANMWGAFHGDVLVGFAVYRAHLTGDMAQYAILHISNGFRNRGIGRALSERVIEKARADGKKAIYVTATPTRATVDFYRKTGFELAADINRELHDLEPDDIHMIMEL